MPASIGQHTKNESPFSSSLTTPSVNTSASGSTFLALAFGGTQPTISDNKANTYDNTRTRAFNATFGFSVCAFVQNGIGGSGHTFTATSTGGGLQLMVAEITGVVLTGGPDAFLSANLTGSTAAIITPTITTVAANAIVIACTGGASNVNSVATSANGTVLDTISGANFVTGADSDFILASPGTANDTLTYTGQTTYDVAGYTISFAPTGGAAGISIAWIRA